MKLTLVALALLAAGLQTATARSYYDSANGGPRAVDVYTGDLNIADPRDREEAAWRIHLATHAACGPSPDPRVLLEVTDYQDCREDAFDDAIDELEGRSAHRHRRPHVYTREYPADDDE
jgi:UrcA family protein